MRLLIRADLRRVLKKPGFYVLIVITMLLFAFRQPSDNAADQIQDMQTSLDFFSITFLCIPIFLSVYGDEFRSGTLQCVIGRGLPRGKVVLAKLLDAAILLAASYALIYLICFVKNCTSGLAVTPRQHFNLFLFCLTCVLRGVGYIALASLVMFLTWSAAGGTVTLIITAMLSAFFLKAIQDWLNFPFYDLSFEGLLNSACTAFQAGRFGWQLIPALGIFLGGVVSTNILIFNRKELEL